jgi:hypothetical protein
MADDKVFVSTVRPWRWEFPVLLTLALLPLLLPGPLCLVGRGRYASLAFYGGLALFLLAGLGLRCQAGCPNRVRDGLAVVGTAVLAFVPVELSTILWVGFQDVEITVRVLDDDTGRPVPAASVWLGQGVPEPPEWLGQEEKGGSRATTDAEGWARLEHSFMAGGTANFLWSSGGPYLGQGTLKVEAVGYRGFQERLPKLVGPAADANGPPLPPVEVRLKKGPRP